MDYVLAKTFIEVANGPSFGAAADRLNVTQTTVTARIKSLEQQLGCTLFVRNKSGAKLTKDGEHFKSYAVQIVQTWQAAQRDLPLPKTSNASLAIGCDLTLWNPIAAKWLVAIREEHKDLALSLSIDSGEQLNEKVSAGGLDVALVHQPKYEAGILVEHLLNEKLVMIRSISQPEPYIFVGWGDEYRSLHDAALPELAHSEIAISLGPVALQAILHGGGSGYFRTRVVSRYIQEGLIEVVPDAPQFSYPVYLIGSLKKEIDMDSIKAQALHVLNESDDWF